MSGNRRMAAGRASAVASRRPVLGALIPFTLIVILPTNKRLLNPSLDKDSQLAQQLLHRWARLHAVRSALGLASFLVFLLAAIWR